MKNLFILMFVFILVMGFASAVIDTLPSYVKLNTCANLIQVENVSSQQITTIVKPDEIVYIYSLMEKNGSFFNYTFCDNDISGGYTVNGINSDGVVWAYDYFVNAQGKEYTDMHGIIYAILLFVLFAVFLLSLYGALSIPFNNTRSSEGAVISINYFKYLKIFLFMVAYVCFLGITYISWNLSFGVLEYTEMANLFYFLFRLLYVGLLVLFPVIVIISFIGFLKDKGIERLVERGLTVK